MRLAIIGQNVFGAEVYKALKAAGHEIVGVFTIPDDKKGRADPLAKAASDDGMIPHKIERWQSLKKDGGKAIPAVIEAYKSCKPDLNVLAFCSQFIPMEVIDFPQHGSIVYHPSLLPRHRGASAVNWTLMSGDEKGGFTIFYADDGLDTGPILLMKETKIEADDTVGSFYNRFLFPEGVQSFVEAVNMIEKGNAPRIVQPVEGATYDPIHQKHELGKIDWKKTAKQLHDWIRGNDPTPGAWCVLNGQQCTLSGSTRSYNFSAYVKSGENGHTHTHTHTNITIEGSDYPGILTKDGLIITGSDREHVLITRITIDDTNKTIPASKFLDQNTSNSEAITLSEEEKVLESKIGYAWKSILNVEIQGSTDFFAAGGASMDVVKLISTVKQITKIELPTEQVYMNSTYDDFIRLVFETMRSGGSDGIKMPKFTPVKMHVNDMDISFPTQLFIDGQFVDAEDNKTIPTINPTNEEVIAHIAAGSANDVNKAVAAAKAAFDGSWSSMNARDRGKLLWNLADVMESHMEELATIESIDSGAVYTLALKTHVGMSIDTFRYFSGWCDKIQGKTIPINNARPNKNLCLTKRLPLGVVGLIVPWNYPLMMLSWKMAAALAAGNTVVIKPAQVTPLTSLKFAELCCKAGIPKGVVNVITGSGSVVGNALSAHPLVRKLGFTGSTPIGKQIMAACSSNLKKVSLELGGKSPLIIFADADIKKAVRNAVGAVFFNKGENCIAAGRLFVEDSIHDSFVQALIEETSKIIIGDPLDRSTSHGPQNHGAHFEKLLEYIQIGIQQGAKCVYGGKRYITASKKGFFLEPTIFTHVTDDMYIAKEESFGPIMIISRFSHSQGEDLSKLLASANGTEFGLCAGVFTQDISKALRISDALEAGTVFINTYNKTDVAAPFGGFKQSGFGKDLGEEALNEYLQTKTITIEY